MSWAGEMAQPLKARLTTTNKRKICLVGTIPLAGVLIMSKGLCINYKFCKIAM